MDPKCSFQLLILWFLTSRAGLVIRCSQNIRCWVRYACWNDWWYICIKNIRDQKIEENIWTPLLINLTSLQPPFISGFSSSFCILPSVEPYSDMQLVCSLNGVHLFSVVKVKSTCSGLRDGLTCSKNLHITFIYLVNKYILITYHVQGAILFYFKKFI